MLKIKNLVGKKKQTNLLMENKENLERYNKIYVEEFFFLHLLF